MQVYSKIHSGWMITYNVCLTLKPNLPMAYNDTG